MLTDQQRRELTIDTMASWAPAGMVPDQAIIDDINAYLDARMTRDEFIEKAKAGRHRGQVPPTTDEPHA